MECVKICLVPLQQRWIRMAFGVIDRILRVLNVDLFV